MFILCRGRGNDSASLVHDGQVYRIKCHVKTTGISFGVWLGGLIVGSVNGTGKSRRINAVVRQRIMDLFNGEDQRCGFPEDHYA